MYGNLNKFSFSHSPWACLSFAMKTPIFTLAGLLDKKKYFYKFTRNWDDDCIKQEVKKQISRGEK